MGVFTRFGRIPFVSPPLKYCDTARWTISPPVFRHNWNQFHQFSANCTSQKKPTMELIAKDMTAAPRPAVPRRARTADTNVTGSLTKMRLGPSSCKGWPQQNTAARPNSEINTIVSPAASQPLRGSRQHRTLRTSPAAIRPFCCQKSVIGAPEPIPR